MNPELDYTGIAANQLDTARTLFETVASVLGGNIRSKVCRGANFYELGGNSLNSVFTVTKLRQQGYVIGQSFGNDFRAVILISSNVTDNLSLSGISSFISSKDLQEVIDQMQSTKEDDTVAATEKQDSERYTAHMLQDEHKDAANQ